MRVEVLNTEELGDRSYVAHDGRVAVVVDPQRDIDRVEKLIADLGVDISVVAETHIHNDYVTGGYELARRTGARYLVSADDDVSFERVGVRHGDEIRAGELTVRALATPGHTHSHLSYVVSDALTPNAAPAVFTGGSLLYGSVGRTDLLGEEHTLALARAQYRSAHLLADVLPDAAAVYPTHGFGSFCSSGSTTGVERSTIGAERAGNDALTNDDEGDFVATLLANLTAYPAYYAHMAPRNLAGPSVPELTPPDPVAPAELRSRVARGEWVVDLRDRVAYAADHAAGTISIELGTQFATYLGWLLPWGRPVTLIGENAQQVADAQRQLVRIGIDELAGSATGPLDEVAAGLPRAQFLQTDFATAAARATGPDDVILDVRRDDERAQGHISGSIHIPLAHLLERLAEVPARRLWVHCASGFRASVAASLLERAGHDVRVLNDDYANASAAGLAMR